MIVLECCPPFQPKPIYRKFGPGHWRIIWLWFGLAYIHYGLSEYVEKIAKAAVSLHAEDGNKSDEQSEKGADMAHPEKIEAAAQALFDRHVARCFARGLQPHHRKGTQVKDMPPSYRDDYLADAAAALAAAIRRRSDGEQDRGSEG